MAGPLSFKFQLSLLGYIFEAHQAIFMVYTKIVQRCKGQTSDLDKNPPFIGG